LGIADAPRVVIDAQGREVGERGAAHGGGEALADMAAWIGNQTGAAPDAVSVAIEVPHGPVVESPMECGLRVHAINPEQLDRFRDRFSPADAKDDSRDAHVLATHYGRTRVAFAALSDWTRSSSNNGSGPTSTMIYATTAIGSAIASEHCCGATIRRSWNWPTTSDRPGSWNSRSLFRDRRRLRRSARRLSLDC
jgi:hypothetical protein